MKGVGVFGQDLKDNNDKFILHVLSNKIQRDQVWLSDIIFNFVTKIYIRKLKQAKAEVVPSSS